MSASNRLEQLTNVAIVVTCGVVVFAIAMRTVSPTVSATPEYGYRVGAAIDTPADLKFGAVDMTAVVFVKSTCPYCTESMGLYRAISALPTRSKGTLRFVAASTEQTSVSRSYLSQNAVSVDQVIEIQSPHPTPTLVLVDRKGIIRAVWQGRQDAKGTQDVLQRLSHN